MERESEKRRKLDKQIAAVVVKKENLKQQRSNEIAGIQEYDESVFSKSQCVASTLANLVLSQPLQNEKFDVVIVDEVSMVPITFILAAAYKAGSFLTLAGDPKQLPPILLANSVICRKWLGRNLFRILNIDQPDKIENVTFLNQDYRMANPISQLVSNLSYSGQLKSEVAESPEDEIIFLQIAVSSEKRKYGEHFSVSEKSYYFPFSALIKARPDLKEYQTVLLSPFRAQKILLGKLADDLQLKQAMSHTIHQSQGSEAEVVILDLTIHDPNTSHSFFKNEISQQIINVALSRPTKKLIILANSDQLLRLETGHDFFKEMYQKLEPYIKKSEELLKNVKYELDGMKMSRWWTGVSEAKDCVYATSLNDTDLQIESAIESLKKIDLDSPFILTRSGQKTIGGRGLRLSRNSDVKTIPPMSIVGSDIFVNRGNDWYAARLPKMAVSLKSVVLGHMVDELIELELPTCILCGRNLDMVKIDQRVSMKCTAYECTYTKSITRKDVMNLLEIRGEKCPKCSTKMSVKQRGIGGYDDRLFLGCPNFPDCDGTRSLFDMVDYA